MFPSRCKQWWPHSPAIFVLPWWIFPSIIIPPPTPVPRITPKTRLWFFPAPSVASARAKQFASFSIDMSWLRISFRSFLRSFPIRHCVLLFFIRPELRDREPGVHMPTEYFSFDSWASCRIRFFIEFKMESVSYTHLTLPTKA